MILYLIRDRIMEIFVVGLLLQKRMKSRNEILIFDEMSPFMNRNNFRDRRKIVDMVDCGHFLGFLEGDLQ
jgi:hypothetical protein